MAFCVNARTDEQNTQYWMRSLLDSAGKIHKIWMHYKKCLIKLSRSCIRKFGLTNVNYAFNWITGPPILIQGLPCPNPAGNWWVVCAVQTMELHAQTWEMSVILFIYKLGSHGVDKLERLGRKLNHWSWWACWLAPCRRTRNLAVFKFSRRLKLKDFLWFTRNSRAVRTRSLTRVDTIINELES